MAIDFKNIVFKFVKITGGTARIDADMTEKIFNSTKPSGVYRCFIFPNSEFGGIDYSDLQNLTSIEKSNMWDKTDRNTFIGFNAETNEFIVNHSAWLSIKDIDLKTDGEVEHSGQVGWFIFTINTTKGVNSKYELLQTDGSKVYLELKPIKETNVANDTKDISQYPACVENELKSVLNQTLYNKHDALFAKCADDNSVVMVHDCVPTVTSGRAGREKTVTLSRDNKDYGNKTMIRYFSSYKFGKKIFSFESTSSKTPINNYFSEIVIPNKTSNTDIELTYTTDINDILSSGEALTFNVTHKQKGFRYIYSKTNSAPFKQVYSYNLLPSYFKSTLRNKFSLYSDKTKMAPSCDLISCDTRKPFIYTPTEIIVGEINGAIQYLYTDNFMKDIPDGIIVLVFCQHEATTTNSILRFKKGDSVKHKSLGSGSALNITGSTMFGSEFYSSASSSSKFSTVDVSKDDVINATGFIDVTPNIRYISIATYGPFFATILRV